MSGAVHVTPRLVLLHAASVIRRDGWIQHLLMSERGVCARGAIIRAVHELCPAPGADASMDEVREHASRQDALAGDAEWLAVDEVKLRAGDTSATRRSLSEWNDARHRQKEEVVDVLEAAGSSGKGGL